MKMGSGVDPEKAERGKKRGAGGDLFRRMTAPDMVT